MVPDWDILAILSCSYRVQDEVVAEALFAEPGVAVRFGMLGALQVVDGAGAARAVPAAKQRIMLAALLLGNGNMVSAADLAEALWDASPPPNAPAVMRTYVTRLRRTLGPVGTRIVGRPPGWAVELHGPEELDLAEVDRLWSAARQDAEAGEWRQVSSLLARALRLWRGEPLVDVPSDSLARREAGRLAELRLQLTEARIDADLRLGRHGELVAELRRLSAEHPLREHIRVQIMLACYRCGHQAAALEVYRDARKTLAEELGVEPGRELREMHQGILTADPGLIAVASAEVTVGQPGGPDGARDPREGGSVTDEAAGYRHGLPLDTAAFTGRDAELELITEAAAGNAAAGGVVAICVISGMPGVGKTALAVHAAHMLAAAFPDRRLFIDLHGHTPGRDPVSPEDALAVLLAAVGWMPGSCPRIWRGGPRCGGIR